MSAHIIDGFSIAAGLREEIKAKAQALGVKPCLAVILAGDDPASVSYVAGKEKALAEAGFGSRTFRLPGNTAQESLLSLLEDLNQDPAVHGILTQFPLPPHIDEHAVLAALSPEKDVDGLTTVNLGRLVSGLAAFIPCTPRGILTLLQKTGAQTAGAHAVILGRSNLVGRPLSLLLSSKPWNATVTVCHTGTRDLGAITRQGDILIAACGNPGLVTASMVKPGAVVIDVGVNRLADSTKKSGFRLTGDVDFEGAAQVAGAITPVPRGVGPMTIAMLLSNTLEACLRQTRVRQTEPQQEAEGKW